MEAWLWVNDGFSINRHILDCVKPDQGEISTHVIVIIGIARCWFLCSLYRSHSSNSVGIIDLVAIPYSMFLQAILLVSTMPQKTCIQLLVRQKRMYGEKIRIASDTVQLYGEDNLGN